jgi:hypothetical protein
VSFIAVSELLLWLWSQCRRPISWGSAAGDLRRNRMGIGGKVRPARDDCQIDASLPMPQRGEGGRAGGAVDPLRASMRSRAPQHSGMNPAATGLAGSQTQLDDAGMSQRITP